MILEGRQKRFHRTRIELQSGNSNKMQHPRVSKPKNRNRTYREFCISDTSGKSQIKRNCFDNDNKFRITGFLDFSHRPVF
jgi:hypothetical protein